MDKDDKIIHDDTDKSDKSFGWCEGSDGMVLIILGSLPVFIICFLSQSKTPLN